MSKAPPKPSEKLPNPIGRAVVLPVRVRKGNNDYELVELTFDAPAAVKVLKRGLSRMEVDYELKAEMMKFVGPNRMGPSDEPDVVLPPHNPPPPEPK